MEKNIKNELISFLENEGLGAYRFSPLDNPWMVLINSPFLSDDKRFKCSIKLDNGSFRCYKTETRGTLYDFIKEVKHLNSPEEAKMYWLKNYATLNTNSIKNILLKSFSEKKEEKSTTLDLPPNSERLDKEYHSEYYKYLLDRKISDEKIDKLNLFVTTYNKRLVFPFYDKGGSLIYYSTRSIVKSNLPWIHCNTPANNIIYKWDDRNTIWITEGIFDAISISGGIALMGRAISKEKEKIIKNLKAYKIVVTMDADIYGLESQLIIANKISKWHKNVYVFNWHKYSPNGEKFDLNMLDQIDEENIYKWDMKGKLLWKYANFKKFPNTNNGPNKDKIKLLFNEKI